MRFYAFITSVVCALTVVQQGCSSKDKTKGKDAKSKGSAATTEVETFGDTGKPVHATASNSEVAPHHVESGVVV